MCDKMVEASHRIFWRLQENRNSMHKPARESNDQVSWNSSRQEVLIAGSPRGQRWAWHARLRRYPCCRWWLGWPIQGFGLLRPGAPSGYNIDTYIFQAIFRKLSDLRHRAI